MKKWLVLAAAAAGLALVTQSALAIDGRGQTVEKVKIWLVTPPDGAVIAQNDASTGCTPSPYYGSGSQITFTWRANHDKLIDHYQLVVRHPSATLDLLNVTTTDPGYSWVGCGGYVADVWLLGWQWKVRAFDAVGNSSDWEVGTFDFAPCRFTDGRSCGTLPS